MAGCSLAVFITGGALVGEPCDVGFLQTWTQPGYSQLDSTRVSKTLRFGTVLVVLLFGSFIVLVSLIGSFIVFKFMEVLPISW